MKKYLYNTPNKKILVSFFNNKTIRFIKAASYALVLFLVLQLSGCKGVLDVSPRGTISDDAIWEDPALIDAYIADVYRSAEIGNNIFASGQTWVAYWQTGGNVIGAEHTLFAAWQEPLGKLALVNINGVDNPVRNEFAQWRWINIRRTNFILEQLETAQVDSSFKAVRSAEIRFLRAFMYFRLVERYGGVPLITKVQNIDDPEEAIMVPRNSEQEIYDFVLSEMDAIIPQLPFNQEPGRANKGAALLLKSRAALYAASIARFGDIQLNGLLGIKDENETAYWQTAFDAASTLINDGPFRLYNDIADKVENFRKIFDPDNGSMANMPEAIFGEVFNGVERWHGYSQQSLPEGPALTWNSNFNVNYEMIELFDFKDGRSGKIPRSEVTSKEWSLQEFILDRDPRMLASVFYPEMTVFNKTIYFHSATRVNGRNITRGMIDATWPAQGPSRNRTRTGFHVRKRSNERFVTSADNPDDNDIVIMRIAEAYLNAAEAAFYLGRAGDALTYINAIRSRAGMPARTTLTEDMIRQERQVELMFENHRYWDLRRWRIAESALHDLRLQGVDWVKNYDTDKYIITFKNGEGSSRIFLPQHYYLPIGLQRVSENPNMVENPGYGY